MNQTANLERAAEHVWDAIKLIKREEHPEIRAALESVFDRIDNQVDWIDEQVASQEDK
jgi:hypothetical protein